MQAQKVRTGILRVHGHTDGLTGSRHDGTRALAMAVVCICSTAKFARPNVGTKPLNLLSVAPLSRPQAAEDEAELAQVEAEAAAQETATAQEEAAAAETQQVSSGGVPQCQRGLETTSDVTTRPHAALPIERALLRTFVDSSTPPPPVDPRLKRRRPRRKRRPRRPWHSRRTTRRRPPS